MSILHLIRHGQASFHSDDYDRLSDLGARQSAILGDYFQRIGVRFDAVVSGSKRRQIDTARIVMERLGLDGKPRVLPELDEHDTFNILREQIPAMVAADPTLNDDVARFYADKDAFKRVFKAAILRWMSGRHAADGLETYADFRARVRLGLEKAAERHGRRNRIAVVSSGGPISTALGFALGISDEQSVDLDLQILNTSVSTFKVGERRLVLTSFNSAAHLELEGDPDLITYL